MVLLIGLSPKAENFVVIRLELGTELVDELCVGGCCLIMTDAELTGNVGVLVGLRS